MVKYSSFVLIASIWFITILCISAASVFASSTKAGGDKDFLNGDLTVFFKALSDISGSPNEFVKFVREHVEKYIALFDKDKKEIQDAVTEGTEIEKQIRNISSTLKNFTSSLPKELQSELDTIEETAAAELTKLQGMENVDDIANMKNKYNEHYKNIKTKIESYSKMAATSPPVMNTSSGSAPQTNTVTNKNLREMNEKLVDLMKVLLPVARSADADEETVSVKLRSARTTLSKIRNEYMKVERIQFHLMRSLSIARDAAHSVGSSLKQFAFAILFAMFF